MSEDKPEIGPELQALLNNKPLLQKMGEMIQMADLNKPVLFMIKDKTNGQMPPPSIGFDDDYTEMCCSWDADICWVEEFDSAATKLPDSVITVLPFFFEKNTSE